jgi:PAT family beta-lactamase induction signal transducer AmpG
VDAALSLVLGTMVLALIWKFGGGFPKPPVSEDEVMDTVVKA